MAEGVKHPQTYTLTEDPSHYRVKEQLPGNSAIHLSSQVDINTFSAMQCKSYNIVKSYYENHDPEEPLYLIILGWNWQRLFNKCSA